MVIVSQDKDIIINYSNVEMIGLDPDNKKEIFCTFSEGAEKVGTYKTEERAKEVLQDILKKVNSQKYLLKPKVRVPKDMIKDAKKYFEKLNGIELIVNDNIFDIVPVGNNQEVIYEMPKE